MGFELLPSELCVFRSREAQILIGVYVDNMVIAAREFGDIDEFKRHMVRSAKVRNPSEHTILLWLALVLSKT
jgi:hypothetical protein